MLSVLGLAAALAWLLFLRIPTARLVPVPVHRWPVVVSTIAGAGTPGRAEGYASAASFSDPFGVAVDRAGNTYVTDAGDNNTVRKIDRDGRVTLLAGGSEGWRDGQGQAARFDTPSGIALAADGTLVVADTSNDAIRRVTPEGAVTTVAGGRGAGLQDGPAASARFAGPIGVAVGEDGGIFVADTYNDAIRRIAPDGSVATVAGGRERGYRDGTGAEARFDTPSGIAADGRGNLFVADTGNNALRRIDPHSRVTTVGDAEAASLYRPVGVAVGSDLSVYVSDSLGRIWVFPRFGAARVIAGSGAGFADGPGEEARFNSPAGLAVDGRGLVSVADSENYLVRTLTPQGEARPPRDVFLSALPLLSPAALGFVHVPWPVDPQEGWHEVTATLGEARGSYGGDGRERLHAGLDVHADPGTLVRAVHDEKVTRPIGTAAHGELNEVLHVGLLSYVHVKVGRAANDTSLDPSRFTVLYDENGQAARVRIRRGTRFRVGDPVGSVNRFAHVHLGLGPRAGEVNLLRFSLPEFGDHVRPTIPPNGVWLVDQSGVRLSPRRGRIDVAGRLAIVVDAWDQVDRNERRRRLGVYALGYQVLRKDGRPVDGFEQPRMTIRFDRLPQRAGAAALTYAEGSGITVYGNRATRFRYVLTNEVQGGDARPGWWDTTTLQPGDYRLRVLAQDMAGNTTTRDVPIRVVHPPQASLARDASGP